MYKINIFCQNDKGYLWKVENASINLLIKCIFLNSLALIKYYKMFSDFSPYIFNKNYNKNNSLPLDLSKYLLKLPQKYITL